MTSRACCCGSAMKTVSGWEASTGEKLTSAVAATECVAKHVVQCVAAEFGPSVNEEPCI